MNERTTMDGNQNDNKMWIWTAFERAAQLKMKNEHARMQQTIRAMMVWGSVNKLKM